MGIYDRPYYQDDYRSSFSFSGRSTVVNLIIINVAVFVIDAFLFGRGDGGLRPSHLFATRSDTLIKPWMWWQFLTYGFCHDPHTVGHVLSNMLGLFFLGQDVERHYGSRLFLRMYLTAIILCGVVWSATRLILDQPNFSLIGASGAVTATVLLFALNFPRRTILFMMFIPMPAWVLGVMLVVFNLMSVQADTRGGDLVAYDVHLVGAVYALVFFKTQWALGNWFTGAWRPSMSWWRRRPKLRVHDPENRQRALEEQADAVLEKLHRHGQDSLTARERRILEEYSRRMQQKRR